MDSSMLGMLFDLFFGAPEFWVPSLAAFTIVATLMCVIGFRNRAAALQSSQQLAGSSSVARADASTPHSASKPKRSRKLRSVTFIVVTTSIVATLALILTFIGTLAYFYGGLYMENM